MHTGPTRIGFFARAFIGVLPWLIPAAAAADPPAGPVVHLADGSFVPGELRGSDDSKAFTWRSPFFARPLAFPLSAVKGVYYAVPPAPPRPRGEFCFELVNDDVIYGDLLGLTDDELSVDSARTGRMRLRRDSIRRLYPWKSAGPIYLGPSGLAGWKDTSAAPNWRDEGGQPTTDQTGASLFGDLGLPEKAAIEIELSWRHKPDFVLALGVDEREASAKFGFHLEVWDSQLVAVAESARDADTARIQRLAAAEGHVRVQLYIDQLRRRLIVLSPGGQPLADLQISDPKPLTLSGVRLTNGKGDVRIEHLRVTRWDGAPPRAAREDQSRLHRTDGSIVYGRLAAFDPATKTFTVNDGTTETRVSNGLVADVFLAPSGNKANPAAAAPEQTLRVTYYDGSRFTGTLTRVEDAHLGMTCPSIAEPVRLPLAEVRSLIPQRKGPLPANTAVGKSGRLELECASLRGRLVDGDAAADASCLVWLPDASLNASPLAKGMSGRIVYREPQQPPNAPPPARLTTGLQALGAAVPAPVPIQRVVPGQVRPVPTVPPPMSGRRSLHLRTGDTIPCEVTRMDETGVTFKSAMTGATFVAHDKIKSVELIDARQTPGIEEGKRDRLLTLPRMQKNSPPTHLICAKNGDFLRGRIVAMDDQRLKVEVRLEVKEVARDRVAQIIWLHADELADGKPGALAVDVLPLERVQVVQTGGNRLTFVAEKADHAAVSGTSDVLGACRAELLNVDQLLIGSVIEQSAAQLAYHNWKLHYATEPKFAVEDADAATGRPSGTESPLVGKPAFAFKLDMLDGTTVNLAERKGRVVVVDFWATWCGPCMQAMPQVEALIREFADRNVDLIAVNLEEQPQQIKSVLERHKLAVPVALDRDGRVAARYGVTAIPQTVVIDREGKIARLFVGGGKSTLEALRATLQELTGDK